MTLLEMLQALCTAIQPHVAAPVTWVIPDIGNVQTPVLIIAPTGLNEKETGTQTRGQRDGNEQQEQNSYSWVYLHDTDDVSGETKLQALTDLYTNVDAFRAAFRHSSVRQLVDANGNPQALSVGDVWHADAPLGGPYIDYLNEGFLGFVGWFTAHEQDVAEVLDV